MERVRIDIVPSGITPVCHASQNDVGRSIRFDLYNGGAEYTLTGTEAINITLRKPNGTTRTQGLTNTLSNYVVYTSTDGDLDEAGIYSCELTIYKGDAILGSRNFVLKVEPDAYDGVNVVVMDCGPADICTFETNLADALVSLTANIVCGGGNGSPDNPIPIVGHSELNLTRCGVNLWNEEWEEGGIIWSTGVEYPNSTSRRTDYISVKPNTTFYSKTPTGVGFGIVYYDEGKNFIISETDKENSSFTIPSGAYYARYVWTSVTDESAKNTICVNYPATDTEYHAYNGQTFTVAFGQTVYGGVYDASGKVKLTWAIDIITNHFTTGNIEDNGFRTNNYLSNTPKAAYGNCICNIFKRASSYAQAVGIASGSENSIGFNAAGQILLNAYQNDAFVNTWTDLDALIPAEGVQIAYELATPIEIDVPALAVAAQVGTNNVFHDGNGQTELKYLKIAG